MLHLNPNPPVVLRSPGLHNPPLAAVLASVKGGAFSMTASCNAGSVSAFARFACLPVVVA